MSLLRRLIPCAIPVSGSTLLGMIVLATDFGLPYIGQMRAALLRGAPQTPIVDLFHDLPAWDVEAAAHLLAAYAGDFPPDAVFCCVVDPGVGSERPAVMLLADDRWFIGPDNGLLSRVANRAEKVELWDITWRPKRLSASFHGRDLFAPVAARLAAEGYEAAAQLGNLRSASTLVGLNWASELARVIYIDGFGNAMTGLRARSLGPDTRFRIGGRRLGRASTFSDLVRGSLFWYENANGLAEIAENKGRAAETLGIAVGDPVDVGSGKTNCRQQRK
jgi:S-adenosylmethionine hydrolase